MASINAAAAQLLQLCLILCDPMDCNPPGSSIREILQARMLSELPCPPLGDLPHPGTESVFLMSPALDADSLSLSHQGSPAPMNGGAQKKLVIFVIGCVCVCARVHVFLKNAA